MYQGSMESGGQGVYLYNVTRELARAGHDVHVISGPPHPDVDPAVAHHPIATRSFNTMLLDRARFFHGVPPLSHFHPLNLYEFATTRFTHASVLTTFSLRALARIAELERRDGPFDLIHDNQTLAYGVLIARAAFGRPVVANVHHPLDVDVRNGLRHVTTVREKVQRIAWYPWQMQPFVARRLDALISGSRASAELIAQLWSLRDGAMNVIYDGVDTERFRPGDDADRVPGALVFVGNSEDYNKGVVYLLRVMRLLPATLNAHLYLVGGPSGALRVAPREIARLGIEDRVTVVGRVSMADLVGWYRRAQVVVSPSLYEGFGLPAAEAMSCGTPVVATSAGALPEVVADGETGVVVPPGDEATLADAIAGLLPDARLRRRLGDAGRQRVLDRFTWARHARGLEALYQRVRAQRVRGRPAAAPHIGAPATERPSTGRANTG